jgi:copper chaperone CopZ
MKKFWITLAVLLAVACNTKPKTDSAGTEEAAAVNAEWVEVVLSVEGMTCEGCENAIKAGVESLDGIAEVESSHEEAWTRVKYDANATSVEEISVKITETGYEVKGER